jgi:hypothetical protein
MKWTNFFRSQSVQVCLFLICGFLYIWPFLAPPVVGRPKAMFVYLFSAWAFILFIAFFISRACRNDSVPRQQHGRASSNTVAAGCMAPGLPTIDEKPFRSTE